MSGGLRRQLRLFRCSRTKNRTLRYSETRFLVLLAPDLPYLTNDKLRITTLTALSVLLTYPKTYAPLLDPLVALYFLLLICH
jgi:hypothetical protein